MTGSGTVTARVSACAAADAAGNLSEPSTTTDNTVQYNAAEITANNDSYETDEDTQRVVPLPGVLGNDVNPSGGSLTAQQLTTTMHGDLAFNPATGAFSYRPFDDYFGTDTFTYRAVNGSATSAPATVTITVKPVNDPPVARNDIYTLGQGMTLTISDPDGGLLANDTDVDSPLDVRNVIAVSGGGTMTVNPNGSFEYVPGAFTGTASFTYEAWDGLAYSTATVTIAVTPAPAAVVESVRINDGSAQRAMINSLTITFASVVDLDASAFKLVHKSTAAIVGFNFAKNNDATGKSVVTLTFTGTGIVGGSLADGNYLLTIDLEKNGFGAGNDHQFGAVEADKFFRFFGDSDGDRDVDSTDYFRIRGALNQIAPSSRYLWFFDYDLDTDVDSSDMTQFLARYRKTLAWTP
jgi:hypothetical protein